MTIKVLYIDGDGPFGGASRSLFEAVRALPAGEVEPYFAASRGTALDVYRQVAKEAVSVRAMSKFDNTLYSHYRGIRWLILLRELMNLPFSVAVVLRARRQFKDIDLIHLNEVVYLFPALLAKRLFGVPLVVHVRSLTAHDQRSRRTRWLTRTLRREAAAVIAINHNTRATLAPDLPVEIIQNSFTAKRAPQADANIVAKLDALRPGSLKVGFVGNLHHSKGLYEMLEAAKILRQSGRDVEFVVVGGVTLQDKGPKAWLLARAGLAQNVQADLGEQIKRDGLDECFHLLGPTLDIKCVYDRLDVLLFPSHYDAPGRPVFEAAFSGVSSIVAVSHPYPDTLVDGETGIAIPAKDAQALADAILHFADNPEEVKRMGENARRLAESNFDPQTNARRLLGVYQRVLGMAPRAASEPNKEVTTQ